MFKQSAAAQSGLLELCPGIKIQTAASQHPNPYTIFARTRLPLIFSHLDLSPQQTPATIEIEFLQFQHRRRPRFNSCIFNADNAIRFRPQVSTFVQLSSDVREVLYPSSFCMSALKGHLVFFFFFFSLSLFCGLEYPVSPTGPSHYTYITLTLSFFPVTPASDQPRPIIDEFSWWARTIEFSLEGGCHQASPGTCN